MGGWGFSLDGLSSSRFFDGGLDRTGIGGGAAGEPGEGDDNGGGYEDGAGHERFASQGKAARTSSRSARSPAVCSTWR